MTTDPPEASQGKGQKEPAANSPLAAIRSLRREEWPFALCMFAQFFLVITTFWILKPLKKTLFIGFYHADGFAVGGAQFSAAEAELLGKTLNMVVAIGAVIVFTLLSRHLRRSAIVAALMAAFIASFASFSFAVSQPGALTVWFFYLFGDLFTTMMVPAFFAFLNDSVSPSEAKRLYGPVGLGGVLGGAFGSTAVSTWIEAISIAQWLWICVGLGVATIAVALAAGRLSERLESHSAQARAKDEERGGDKPKPANAATEGAQLVLRSPYLLAIVAIVGAYEIVSTILDFQFTATVQHFLDKDQLGGHFSMIYAITNVSSALIQLIVTPFVLNRYGVGPALMILPLAIACGSAGFLILPVLALGSALSPIDNALNYSIQQSAREALYVPRSADEKYKAKAFIDMFVQRFAKTLAVGVSLLAGYWFEGFESVRWLSLVTVPLTLGWLAATRFVGREFREQEKAQARAKPASA